jgi:hypothetical protein
VTDSSASALLDDFRAHVNDGLATLHFAGWAMKEFADRQAAIPADPANPDPQFPIVNSDSGSPRMLAVWRLSRLVREFEFSGPAENRLGQQWIVTTFSEWEERVRPAVAAAVGVEKNEVAIPVLGDLRNWRNDIVHHGAVATAGNSGKNQILNRFMPGDPIVPLYVDHITFFDELNAGAATFLADHPG